MDPDFADRRANFLGDPANGAPLDCGRSSRYEPHRDAGRVAGSASSRLPTGSAHRFTRGGAPPPPGRVPAAHRGWPGCPRRRTPRSDSARRRVGPAECSRSGAARGSRWRRDARPRSPASRASAHWTSASMQRNMRWRRSPGRSISLRPRYWMVSLPHRVRSRYRPLAGSSSRCSDGWSTLGSTSRRPRTGSTGKWSSLKP